MASDPRPWHHPRVITSIDRAHQLRALLVGDEPSAWEAAGFTVTAGAVLVGTTVVVLDPALTSGIGRADVSGLEDDVDGVPIGPIETPNTPPQEHRNRVCGFDHLVVMSPAIQRTSDALVRAGLDLRRSRTFPVGGHTRRQDFFWLGDVILELVGVDGVMDDGPATVWGLAFECDDLDAAVSELGEAIGPAKDAVQPGRRIATIRSRELGISVPIALMSRHVRRGDD